MSDLIANPTQPAATTVRPRRTLSLILIAVVACAGLGMGGVGAYRYYGAWRHGRSARAALERGDLEQARADLDAYLAVWPNSAEDHFLAARTARRLDRYDEAEAHLHRAQELGWKRDDILLERRLMRIQRGELSREDRHLLAQTNAGNADAVLILEALAEGYSQSSMQTLAALDIVNRLLERDPKNVRGLLWRGELYERLQQRDEAIQDYTAILALDDHNVAARDHLAWALLHAGLHDQALPHFERLHRERPDEPRALLGLALCRRENGEAEEAARLLDTLLAQHPDDPEALRERGQLAFFARQPERAEHWLREAVRREPADEAANHLLARCLRQQIHKNKSSLPLTTPWVALYVWLREEEANGYQAVYETLVADRKRFGELYPELVQRGATRPDPYCEVANILLRVGRPEDAREWFHQALRVDPQYRPAREALDRLERPRGRP